MFWGKIWGEEGDYMRPDVGAYPMPFPAGIQGCSSVSKHSLTGCHTRCRTRTVAASTDAIMTCDMADAVEKPHFRTRTPYR